MRKEKFIIATATLAFFASCSNSTKIDGTRPGVDSLPSNPTNKQVYNDCNGNRWIYDAIMMRWALFGGMGTGGNTYYYYPSSGSYTNHENVKVEPPSTVKEGISSGIAAKKASSTSSSVNKSSTSTSKGRAVFGRIGSGKSSVS